MSRKSDNPMEYRVRSASGFSRYFRKRESAEEYFEKYKKKNPDEILIFENMITNTIIKDYINPKYVSTPIYTEFDKCKVINPLATVNDCDICDIKECPADDVTKRFCEKLITSGYVSSDVDVNTSNSYTVTNNTFPYKLYYKDGVLYKEKKENKFIKFFKKLFKKD